MAEFDPNVWYHISEERVDNATDEVFGSTLQTTQDGLRVFALTNQAWQMQPIDDEPGLYLMRHNSSGVGRQLSVCWDPEEAHNSKTIACMQPSSVDDAQKHFFEEIGTTGAFLWKPWANNSVYAMDVHPGSNLFLNDQIQGENSDALHPAQRWVFSSARDVNDGAWSTIYSGESAVSSAPPAATSAASTTASTTSADAGATTSSDGVSPAETSGASEETSSDSGGGGITPGAAAGIGVGATIAGLALIGAIIFFFWRRRRASRAANPTSKSEGGEYSQHPPPSQATTPANGDQSAYPPGSNEHKAGAMWGGAYPQGDQQYSSTTHHSSPPHDVHSPHSATGYSQAPQSEPAEAPFQPIHEAPSHQYTELDASQSQANGMNSVQQTPATQYYDTRL